MSILFLFTFSLFILLPSFTNGMRQQAVGVKGQLFCGSTPAGNVLVKLFDKDTGMDPDDELDSGYTDQNGLFQLAGDEREMTNIDPQLKFYHNCNKGINPCPRKWILNIPDKYIHSGQAPPEKYFDLGKINLEVEIESETFDCVH